MTVDPTKNVTQLLARAQSGDRQATNELFPVVYEELRQIASGFMANERAGHTLQPTALVNEAYMRLVGPTEVTWENRAHFFGAAARAIRRILTDHARAKGSLKRGGNFSRQNLDEIADSFASREPISGEDTSVEGIDLVELDAALTRLAEIDEQKARVVELRFFAGLTSEQAAAALGVSLSTVARDWQFARLWLHRELENAKDE